MSSGEEWANDNQAQAVQEAKRVLKTAFTEGLMAVAKMCGEITEIATKAADQMQKIKTDYKFDGVKGPEDPYK